MRGFARCLLIFLRIFPQNKAPAAETQKFLNIESSSSKVVPLNEDESAGDEDLEEQPAFKESVTLSKSTFSGENSFECTNSPADRSSNSFIFDEGVEEVIRKKKGSNVRFLENLVHVSEYEYHLRATPEDDVINLSIDIETIRDDLFDKELSGLIRDDEIVRELYQVALIEVLHGRRPVLPWSLESFLTFLFLDSRDLRLIQVMLRLCQLSPFVLVKFDQILKEHGCEMSVRENLLLPFLTHVIDADYQVARTTVQLMGFKGMRQLLMYYRYHLDYMVNNCIWKLEQYSGVDDLDSEDSYRNYEYIYEPDMID